MTNPVFHNAHLSMAYLKARDIKNAENCASVVLKSSQKHDEKYFEALSRIMLAQSIVKSDKSRFNEGKRYILGAFKMLDELKMKPIYATGIYFLGQTCTDASQKDIARKNFEEAEALFRKTGMDYWIGSTKEALASL
ncbi:MAG: hypothetical protein JW915_11800 [Chitinispirillaceae bacterium]|nr:hypothetical protein [Chitinispirillaceae bacterium]